MLKTEKITPKKIELIYRCPLNERARFTTLMYIGIMLYLGMIVLILWVVNIVNGAAHDPHPTFLDLYLLAPALLVISVALYFIPTIDRKLVLTPSSIIFTNESENWHRHYPMTEIDLETIKFIQVYPSLLEIYLKKADGSIKDMNKLSLLGVPKATQKAIIKRLKGYKITLKD